MNKTLIDGEATVNLITMTIFKKNGKGESDITITNITITNLNHLIDEVTILYLKIDINRKIIIFQN